MKKLTSIAQGILASHDLIFTGSFFFATSLLFPLQLLPQSEGGANGSNCWPSQARLWAKPSHAGDERETKDRAGMEAT